MRSDDAISPNFKVKVRANRTDLGNAKLLVDKFGRDLRYCPQLKKWFIWNGNRWAIDEDGEITRRAKKTAHLIQYAGVEDSDKDARARRINWGLKSESASHINAMTKLAETEPGIPIMASQFDNDPMLLGVANGIINLRTGEHIPPDPSHYITKNISVEYDKDASCPRWLSFLSTICKGNDDLIAYFQRVLGYTLTGLTREQCMFVLFGPGANGKTVFCETIALLMGDYAANSPPDTFMERKNAGGPSPDLARLRGTRLVLASEPDDGSTLAEALVKRVTGEDTIVCRHLYADYIEFKPQFKVFLRTNHKPIVRGDGYAIWRRIQLIPLPKIIPETNRENDLQEKLSKELPGILNWGIQGVLDYQQIGLAPPKAVLDATQEYRSEMDVFGDWLSEETVDAANARSTAANLYNNYSKWCITNQGRSMSKKKFGQKLQERGFRREHTRHGSCYVGLSLNHERRDGCDG